MVKVSLNLICPLKQTNLPGICYHIQSLVTTMFSLLWKEMRFENLITAELLRPSASPIDTESEKLHSVAAGSGPWLKESVKEELHYLSVLLFQIMFVPASYPNTSFCCANSIVDDVWKPQLHSKRNCDDTVQKGNIIECLVPKRKQHRRRRDIRDCKEDGF